MLKNVLLGCLGLVVLGSIGCQNKFTYQRFEMVQVGAADKKEVELTLGKPSEKPFKDLWWYYNSDATAKIYFDEKDTVKAKKWINEKTGEIAVEPEGWIEK
jgi:outer membrane protein assembly factor BamE (lipoprotein component of BamABCDE complex)